MPSQAWILNAKPYHFTKNQGAVSVRSAIENSIDGLFEREAKLQQLKLSDPNINTKLSFFYVCGDSRGVWGSSLADVRQIISNYLLGDGGYSESDMMIATMVENSSGGNTIWSLDGNNQQRYAKAEELFRKLQDENDPLRFLLVINRGRSGINVHNLTSAVICRIRDPKEVRTPIPIQIFGRMVRLNCGTGNIVRQKYSNNLDNYLTHYSHDYDVDIKTVIETIKIANVFDIYHPTNGKAKRTWEESLVEFEKDYVNNAKSGYEYLYSFTGIEKPSCVTTHISSEIPLNCPFCGENVEKKISEWIESGAITLDRFFE